jgi:hypothetical protein
MTNEFTALTDLQAPNTTVYGYRRGDPVPPSVVENWNLEVGEHVVEGDLTDDQVPESQKLPRPGDEDTRATWEAYAVANGMDPEEAASASQDDLEAYEPKTGSDEPSGPFGFRGTEAGGQPPTRPADGAPKAEWVTYVTRAGADEEWAKASGTTKADLQAWEPTSGDTIAVAATEANSGS